MTIPADKVQEMCGRIEGDLTAFEADPKAVGKLQGALRQLQRLREQYHDSRSTVEPYVPWLKALREHATAAIRNAREHLAAEYLRAGAAAAAWRDQQDACRDLLVELARTDRLEQFACPEGTIQVKHVRAVSLPPPNSTGRQELMAALLTSGHLQEIAQPIPARLLKAMDSGLLRPDVLEKVARLCPIREDVRLVASRPGE